MINLTVIGDRQCSTTRAYLQYLKNENILPKRLWLIDFHSANSTVKLLRRLGLVTIGNKLHGHSKPQLYEHSEEFRTLCRQLQSCAGLAELNLFNEFTYEAMALEVEFFSAEDYTDPYLQTRIVNSSDSVFLYTNGGLVPKSLLDVPGVKILHIHPGIVPQVRGSDGMLWSWLIRRRLGMSCFYMSSGIDEGLVLARMETEFPDLSVLSNYLDTTDRQDMAYRALLHSVDPHYRAKLLVKLLKDSSNKDLKKLSGERQQLSQWPAYLWMHPKVRKRALLGLAK